LLVAKYVVYDITDFSALDDAKQAMIKVADLAMIRDSYVILAVFVLFVVNKITQSKEEGVTPSLGETFKKLFGNRIYILGILVQILDVGA
jgi:FHS family L-fucose permease-like MFS transporter